MRWDWLNLAECCSVPFPARAESEASVEFAGLWFAASAESVVLWPAALELQSAVAELPCSAPGLVRYRVAQASIQPTKPAAP